MADYPFVNRLTQITTDIRNKPTKIFEDQTYGCCLQVIRIVNVTNNTIAVTVTQQRQTQGTPQTGRLGYQISVRPYETQDLLTQERGGLQFTAPGDELYGFSDSPINIFDCHVCYLQYQLPPQP